MKTKIVFTLCLLSALIFGGCGKHNNKPSAAATAKITNIDGNTIQFSSSSGNTATLVDTAGDGTSDMFSLHLEDSKAKITIDIWTLAMSGPTTINLDGNNLYWNYAKIHIGSNPSGKQDFCTCGDLTYDGNPDGGGTLTITSIGKGRIQGTLDNMVFFQHNFLVKAVKLQDGKFDLKLDKK